MLRLVTLSLDINQIQKYTKWDVLNVKHSQLNVLTSKLN